MKQSNTNHSRCKPLSIKRKPMYTVINNNNSVGTQANKNDASIKTHIYCDQLNKNF